LGRNCIRKADPCRAALVERSWSQKADQEFLVKAPTLSMPKGGGAIRGLGEKFANPVTGSATFTIPLPLSPARSGFGPELALKYDSGSGNGPFGFGWTLALPAITRKTDKGLPRYRDSTDVLLLAGAEDLVPVLDTGGEIADDRTSVAVPEHRDLGFQPRLRAS
jgi:virulence plasmid B protein